MRGRGGKRRQVLGIGLGIALIMGTAVYFRLWTIDYRISSEDSELLRRQFDFASKEAMDESAEWRRRYDMEMENSAKCFKELEQMKRSFGDKAGNNAGLNKKLEMLQKENMDLRQRVEFFGQKLEAEKFKCSMGRI